MARIRNAEVLRSGNSYRAAIALWAAALAAIVAYSVLAHGVPALRHDWSVPRVPAAIGPWLASFFQPWVDSGIGSPQAYPTFYWIGFLLFPLHAVGNPWVFLVIIVAGTMYLAALSAASVAENMNAPRLHGFLAAAIAVLNPWVYSEYVAGHIFMVLAYVIGLALIAETTRTHPRNIALILLSALAITQLEFLLILALPYAFWCARKQRISALVAFAVSCLPIAVGIAFRYANIRGTQYTLVWQQAASVPLTGGALLTGYEFNYANAFDPFRLAIAVLGILAVLGLIAARRKPGILLVGILAVASLIAASGTRGPIAAPYSWLVLHVPESGVYRELFDLIAVVAIGYIVGIAALPKRLTRYVALLGIPAIACLFVPWFARPVYTFFVPGSTVPAARFAPNPMERVALFPAFQPLSYRGQGSGFDPDLFPQAGRALPVNDFLPAFPVDAALSYAWFDGNYQLLQALGVTSVLSRPYLRTNWVTLKYQQVDLNRPIHLPADGTMPAVPTVALTDGVPRIGFDPQDLLSNSVFLEGSPDASVHTLNTSRNANLDYRKAWIDVSLAAITHPEWATAFGGVITAGSRLYPLPHAASSILAQTNGRLKTASGRLIATASNHLRWRRLPRRTRSVRCFGTCVLVLAANEMPGHRLPAADWHGTSVREISPWAYALDLPASHSVRTLRFAETYTGYWTAILRATTLRHVRLNTILNGWIVPANTGGRVYLVERLALAQFVCECLALLVVLLLLVGTMINRAPQLTGPPHLK